MEENNTKLLIFPETDIEVTNLDLSQGDTNWVLIDFEIDNGYLVKSSNTNTSFSQAKTFAASVIKDRTYTVRYTVTGALPNTQHYTALRGIRSVYNYGNGTFTSQIVASKNTGVEAVIVFVINKNGILSTEDYDKGRRIKISDISIKEVKEYEVELYDNISIPLTFQIADVQDISKRSTSFSKTIVIPGSPENNIVFKHAYMVSNDYAFKLDTPVRARLLNDTIEIFNGYLFLQNITLRNEDNTIEYNADLRSSTNSLFKIASQKYLRGNDGYTVKYEWTFTDNQFVNGNLGFIGSTKHNFKVGDEIFIAQSPGFTHIGYEGLCEVIDVTDYTIITNKTFLGGTPAEGGIATRYTEIKSNDDIDLSEWNHTLSYKNTSESWWKGSVLQAGKNKLPDRPTNGNDVLGQGYVYPLIDYGYNETLLRIEEFAPAIFVKEVFDKIIRQAGFTYTSTFLNSDRFKRLILPKIAPVILTEELASQRNATYRSTSSTWNDQAGYNTIVHGTSYPEIKSPKTLNLNKLTGVNATTNKYTVPNRGKYYFRVDIYNAIKIGVCLNNNGATGYYVFNTIDTPIGILRLKIVAVYNGSSTVLDTHEVSIATSKVAGKTFFLTKGSTNPTWFTPVGVTNNTSLGSVFDTFSTDNNGVELERGTVIELQYEFEAKHRDNGVWIYKNISGQEVQDVYSTLEIGDKAFKLSTFCLGGIPVFDGDDVDMNQLLPLKSVKHSDILTSIIKMFNLYISPDDNNINNLIIEPRDDFYSGGEIIDWTQKRDLDSDFVIEQASDMLNKNILFTYTQDDNDYQNTQFTKDSNNLVYGQHYVKADIATPDTYEIKPIFAPTIINDFITGANNDDIIVPQIYAKDELGALKNSTFKMRILYWGGLQYWPLVSGGQVGWRLLGSQGSTSTKFYKRDLTNFFPYAGHYDSPFTKTFDLNFGQMPFYRVEGSYTTNNLVNLYYSKMLNELTSPAARKVTAYLWLTDEDIFNFNWKNKYIIDSVYYRANKIIDYVPNKLTKVELLKVIEEDDLDINIKFTATRRTAIYRVPLVVTNYTLNTRTRIPYVTTPIEADVYEASPNYKERITYMAPPIEPLNSYNGYGIVLMSDSVGNDISGDYITLENGVTNSTVKGSSDITIKSGLSNVSVIDSTNLIVTESNVTYINNIKYKDGIQMTNIDIINGGEDEVQDKYGSSIINTLDGGLNTDRDFGSMSINNIVDGNR